MTKKIETVEKDTVGVPKKNFPKEIKKGEEGGGNTKRYVDAE